MIFSGFLDLPWWGYIVAALALTHVTIAGVTIYLHRCQAHRALELHPVVSHFFRFWLWLTTGMVTREWAAIHRKHHAKCETADDPHSPQIHGINKVLWAGVFLYVKESYNRETLERYGHGTPNNWLEPNFYNRFSYAGDLVLLGVNGLVFGIVPGVLVWLVQIAWIPFLAAGVINGVGHYWGYRQWSTPDASTNIVPWGFLIGGEELHNNHHAYPTSARFSNKWYELDVGWWDVRILAALGLAVARHVPPTARFAAPKALAGVDTLEAIIRCRYEVLARYDKMLQQPKSHALETIHAMRHELAALWGRSKASREHLVAQLQDWCRRAEASGIAPLAEFSQRLRCYA